MTVDEIKPTKPVKPVPFKMSELPKLIVETWADWDIGTNWVVSKKTGITIYRLEIPYCLKITSPSPVRCGFIMSWRIHLAINKAAVLQVCEKISQAQT